MKIEHVALYVCDLEKAKDFFVEYLGVKTNDGYFNKKTGFRSYFLTFDSGARLEIMTRPEVVDSEKEPFQTGWAHLAFSLGSAEAVDKLTEKLSRAGFCVQSGPRTTGDGYYESAIVAIEQNIIELTD